MELTELDQSRHDSMRARSYGEQACKGDAKLQSYKVAFVHWLLLEMMPNQRFTVSSKDTPGSGKPD